MRVVIDTNCLIASIPRHRPEFWLYEAFKAQKFDWVISNEILSEYYEILSDFYSPQTADVVTNILLLSDNVYLSEPFFKWDLITKDPDDNKFANLAISANVDFLVSNDKHFSVLQTIPFPTVKVLTLTQFHQVINPPLYLV
jgi:uncharacterized protein